MRQVDIHRRILLGGVWVATAITLFGCMKSNNNPVSSGIPSGSQVSLAMAFSRTASGISLRKSDATMFADSIRIDSIVVVVEKIRLHPASDSIGNGGNGGNDGHGHGDGHGGDGGNGDGEDGVSHVSMANDGGGVVLDGPFIIHVRDTLSVDFASQSIPAGTYNSISFTIHRLHFGEQGFDSDDHREIVVDPLDSSLVGSSVVIWGAVMKNGTWTSFTFNSDLELEVNIPGTFIVPDAISSINLAFNFNLDLLFKDPSTGAFLDPSDMSWANHQRINQAILNAFGRGHCGNDNNRDGHLDD